MVVIYKEATNNPRVEVRIDAITIGVGLPTSQNLVSKSVLNTNKNTMWLGLTAIRRPPNIYLWKI